jgi:hypothetical protein
MASISWPLRIRAVPLIPSSDARPCSSASTMPESPVALRVRLRVPVRAGLASPWSVVDPLLGDPSGAAATGSRTSVLSDTDWSFLIDEEVRVAHVLGRPVVLPARRRWPGSPCRCRLEARRRLKVGIARVSAVVVSAGPGHGLDLEAEHPATRCQEA